MLQFDAYICVIFRTTAIYVPSQAMSIFFEAWVLSLSLRDKNEWRVWNSETVIAFDVWRYWLVQNRTLCN